LTYDGTFTYIYDCENRLIEVKQNGQTIASYAYDYLGRRVSKTVNGTITKFCYDGDQVIMEYDGSDNTSRRFIYGAGIDEPVYGWDSVGGSFYYHFDGLGSVVALSDYYGNIVERYSYDVFGEPNTTSDVGNPYMFTGRHLDTESGLYYYRARYYSPYIGRFLQTDPIGYEDSLNLYVYCLNNPVRYIDSSGHGIIVPPDAFRDHGECPALEGYYRHCVACCRLHMWIGAIPTYLINLWFGDDWPCEGESINSYFDRKACRQGIKNRYKVWDTCRTSCKKSTKKAIEKYCPSGYEWKD